VCANEFVHLKVSNVVMELDGNDNLTDRVKYVGIRHGIMGEKYIFYTSKQRKANWIGRIQRRNILSKHYLELRDGKIGRICK
jgi:hypothetical protein